MITSTGQEMYVVAILLYNRALCYVATEQLMSNRDETFTCVFALHVRRLEISHCVN